MALRLDHIVLLVEELDRATADYRGLGFSVVNGGDHSGGATHNALVVFEDGAYLELIAYKQPAPEARWWQTGRRSGEGWVDYALLPDDIKTEMAEARRHGLVLDGPNEGGRHRPDGVRLEWQTARAATSDLPFFCADVTARNWRVPEGKNRCHANGAVAIAALTVAVNDLDVSVARYEALLQDTFHPVLLTGFGIRCAPIKLASLTVNLAMPLQGSDPAGAALRSHLETRGEGPYAVAIAVRPGFKEGALKRSQTHGAPLELVANNK